MAADQAGAQFALPNVAHRDRCVELAPQVEAALTQHFGSPIRLVLVVDGGSADPPRNSPAPAVPAGRPPAAPAPDEHDEHDEVDLEDLVAATAGDIDQASAAEARLLEAFPGASEVGE